jgi:1-acyl-sn-glycerol-3-phosphate acyltransferase
MHPLANGIFGTYWTVGVTCVAAAAARISRDRRFADGGQRLWGRGLLKAWGVSLTVEGAENICIGQAQIIMANHSSHVDIPVCFAALPIVPGFLAKKELSRIPFLSLALREGNHVLVDRADGGSALQAVKGAAAEIRRGKTVAIFPEGTRGDGRSLMPFKRGGFLIAKRAAVPVVPIGIIGTRDILAPGEYLPRAGKVRVRIGTPISAGEVRRLGTSRLELTVRQRIAELSGLALEST